MDICPQAGFCIYTILPVYRNIVFHNPVLWQKPAGRNPVPVPLSGLHPRILIAGDLLQRFPAIHSKCIYDKIRFSISFRFIYAGDVSAALTTSEYSLDGTCPSRYRGIVTSPNPSARETLPLTTALD